MDGTARMSNAVFVGANRKASSFTIRAHFNCQSTLVEVTFDNALSTPFVVTARTPK